LKKELLHRQIQHAKELLKQTEAGKSDTIAVIPTFSPQKIEKMKKAELIQQLKEYTKYNCQLCITNECECVALNIPCSMMTCHCIRSPHIVVMEGNANAIDDMHQMQGESCANPHGRDIFDPEKVGNYRQQVLSALKLKNTHFVGEDEIDLTNSLSKINN